MHHEAAVEPQAFIVAVPSPIIRLSTTTPTVSLPSLPTLIGIPQCNPSTYTPAFLISVVEGDLPLPLAYSLPRTRKDSEAQY